MGVDRILFVTGPPGSGKSTLSQAIARSRPSQITVISTSSLIADSIDPWRQLGAMYHDEIELACRAIRAIGAAKTPDVIIDGAPREVGQLKWGIETGALRSVVVLNGGPWPNNPQDLARHARWYGHQVHELAKALVKLPHYLMREARPSHNDILTWWDNAYPREERC